MVPARGICVRNHLAHLTATLLIALVCHEAVADELSVMPATMARVGTVDERFQSYNVEMIEVTGGRFWKPYGPTTSDVHSDLFEYRSPIDLTSPRLRRLAAALAPAYMRVSGSWANATYFAEQNIAPSAPPSGFNDVLPLQRWRAVIEFSQAVGAQIVTSFAVSPGTRDAAGVWTADQAHRFLNYTRATGGSIAAAEFMNEPNLATPGGAPAGDDAGAYGRDFKVFRAFMKDNFPETMILGPGTIGEATSASELLAASGAGTVDVFSYHHYGALSERCKGPAMPEAALSEEWLSRTDRTLAFYRSLRDRFDPGKPIWLTETAEAACGGDRWAATFLDTFRYLDQLGRLARAGVQVVMHNTLAASDYGLLDERTLAPRPNYWAALLWRQMMGTIVLDPGVPVQTGFHVYAHCRPESSGGVTLLAINASRDTTHALRLPDASERFTLEAATLQDGVVHLNGHPLQLSATDDLPAITGVPMEAGIVTFAPATITFLSVPAAGNSGCR
jgi:hypothetical protein